MPQLQLMYWKTMSEKRAFLNPEIFIKISEFSPATIMVTDKDHKLLYVNPKFTELTKYTFEEVLGKNTKFFNSGETQREIYDNMYKHINNKRSWDGVFTNRKKNGDIYHERAIISPILNDRGEITHFIAIKEDITEELRLKDELLAANKKLKKLAEIDYLTDLYNRRIFIKATEQEISYSLRYKTPFSILMLDLDFFKSVNDNYGHITGDKVLVTVAKHIKQITRKTDIPSRYGGEEFTLLLKSIKIEKAAKIAEKLRKDISETIYFSEENEQFNVTCSIGIAEFNGKDMTCEDLLSLADERLYKAKESGRNRVVWDTIS